MLYTSVSQEAKTFASVRNHNDKPNSPDSSEKNVGDIPNKSNIGKPFDCQYSKRPKKMNIARVYKTTPTIKMKV